MEGDQWRISFRGAHEKIWGWSDTMPFDYSRRGYKEMFANYGLTALAAQCLEKTVLILFITVECIEKKKIQHKTFGIL
jgi:hypothetical protein